jgi:hypothetical protein
MATAKRLYLYSVSGTGLGMAAFGAVALLHLLLNRVGLGPQNSGAGLAADADRDLLAVAIAVGIVGLALWIFHWAVAERMVKAPGEAGASERASIVRSLYFAVVLAILLGAAAAAVQQLSDSIANVLGARQSSSLSIDDSWSVAAIVVFSAAWAYHAWIRARDVRQESPIEGAAAWVSRFYLYGAAFVGLVSMLASISSIIYTAASEIANNSHGADFSSMFLQPAAVQSATPWWVRPVVAAIVGLAVWGAIWLGHWLYSNRLRAGESSTRSTSERTSRVRLAFMMVVVIWGVSSIAGAVASGVGSLLMTATGTDFSSSLPLWYTALLPALAALPAVAAWLLHRRRAFDEAAVGPAGVSATRIASYLTAWVGLGLILQGCELGLATIFGKWLPGPSTGMVYSGSDSVFKLELSLAAGYLLAGLIFWVWPWFSSQRRRHEPASAEIGSSSRGYYLYAVVGSAILAGAFSLAFILYPYLRLAFGLPQANLASIISTPLALLLVSAGLLAYHAFVLRSDARPPRLPASWPAAAEPPASVQPVPAEPPATAPAEAPVPVAAPVPAEPPTAAAPTPAGEPGSPTA